MKYICLTILLSALAFAQTGTSSAAPAGSARSSSSVPVDQQDQNKARALLNQMIQAIGGDAYLNIKDVTQEGRTYSFHLGRPTSAGLLFWRFYEYPDKDRIEFTKKRDVAEVFNGDNGGEITYKGMHPMDAKDLADYDRRRQYALDLVLRKWLNEPGIALFDEGPAIADQKPTEQITLMNSRDQAVTIYVDTTTHFPVKKSFSWRDPTDKQRNIEEESYDGYRAVAGIITPFVVTRYYNGDMSNQRFLTAVSYNKGLNDSMFSLASLPAPSTDKNAADAPNK